MFAAWAEGVVDRIQKWINSGVDRNYEGRVIDQVEEHSVSNVSKILHQYAGHTDQVKQYYLGHCP